MSAPPAHDAPADHGATAPTRGQRRALLRGLGEVSIADAHRLQRRVNNARTNDQLSAAAAAIAQAADRLRTRAAAVPPITYPEQLPVSARRADIAAAIQAHQVVVVAGETGSGKTTQLPKICLELGRGVRGMIGHTQPRRLAARAVAARLSEELVCELGTTVGFSVRFTDRVGPATLVKLMTDGILLAEIQRDPLLRAYDTLIIDEAHERSLNIDFLLGYLHTILPQRPDLKLIITSATIDPHLFATHFSRATTAVPARSGGPASRTEAEPQADPVSRAGAGAVDTKAQPSGPVSVETKAQAAVHDPVEAKAQLPDLDAVEAEVPVIEVSGRSYPVEIRYRPLEGSDDAADRPDNAAETAEPQDPLDAICAAVQELLAEGDGDILVFLSGEREIRDAADAIADRKFRNTEIVPLFARLSAADQQKVFAPHTGRRVVLATNVAETSLTVPGIRYVVDPGFARISRYSLRTKVQRLPIEPISQASARQRAGRCGRVADGICIRLYSEADFEARPTFTDPEILRTNLAAVILRMAASGLGKRGTAPAISEFPFVTPPDARSIRDGIALLHELGAITNPTGGEFSVTEIGRTLARIPIEPRLARMLIAAHTAGCLDQVLVIVAGLAIPDVRETPLDNQQAAHAAHARFAEPHSDFLSYLRLWNYLGEQRTQRSVRAFRTMCRAEFLHWQRIREWQDLHGQLTSIVGELGWQTNANGSPAGVPNSGRAGSGRTGSDRAGSDRSGSGRSSSGGPGAEARASERRGSEHSAPGASGGAHASSATRRTPNGVAPDAVTAGRGAADQRGFRGRADDQLAQDDPVGDVDADRVHQAILTGLLSQLGVKDEQASARTTGQAPARRRGPAEYLGSRGARFAIHPGSALAKHPPHAVMAAELVETTRLWARTAARIQPEWAERLAPELVKRQYSEPRWSAKRGTLVADEQVSLYGVVLVARRTVDFSAQDPELARDLLIRHALIRGECARPPEFYAANQDYLEQWEKLHARTRTAPSGIDDDAQFAFYDARVPADVVTMQRFDKWWKQARRSNVDMLRFTDTAFGALAGVADLASEFPTAWRQGELTLDLRYNFAPGSPDDGITVLIPIAMLNQVRPVGFDWLVPGLRAELATALVKSLPKQLRRAVVPAPDRAAQAMAVLRPRTEPLRTGLARELSRIGGVRISPADFDEAALPPHLRVAFAAVAGDGAELGRDEDLAQLQARLAPEATRAVAAAAHTLSRPASLVWSSDTLGTLAPTVQVTVAGQQTTGFPTLRASGDGVEVTVVDTKAAQADNMREAIRTLVRNAVTLPAKKFLAALPVAQRIALSTIGSTESAFADVLDAAIDALVQAGPGNAHSPEEFDALLAWLRPRLPSTVSEALAVAAQSLEQYAAVVAGLESVPKEFADDIRAAADDLVFPGFITHTGLAQARELPRYLEAANARIAGLAGNIQRDRDRARIIHDILDEYDALLESLDTAHHSRPDVVAIRWQIEELRVSVFAQNLGTKGSVSAKRVTRAIAAARS